MKLGPDFGAKTSPLTHSLGVLHGGLGPQAPAPNMFLWKGLGDMASTTPALSSPFLRDRGFPEVLCLAKGPLWTSLPLCTIASDTCPCLP